MNTFNLGSKLKNTRETMRLTLKEASLRLRINHKFLSMLEEESFDNTLPITFMKGYLRSYARLLNFTENETQLAVNQLNALLSETKIEKAPSGFVVAKNIKKEKWHRILTYMIVFTLILLVTLWWKSHSDNVKTTALPSVTPPPPVVAQPPLAETVVKPVEPPPTVVTHTEQNAAPPPEPPLKAAQNNNPISMAVPDEPGLDLSEGE